LTALDFCPRQGQHLQRLHPARKAVSYFGKGQDIRRAREKKPARTIILIDGLLDGEQQIGRTLDLIDDGPV